MDIDLEKAGPPRGNLQHELNTAMRDGDIGIYEGYRNNQKDREVTKSTTRASAAVGGAIGGDAGKGAAIGAGVGAAAGVMKQGRQNRQAAGAQQQAQAQAQAARAQYDKVYGVCLEGRRYQVK